MQQQMHGMPSHARNETAPPVLVFRKDYLIGPPFFVCGTPSVIHCGAGVPFR